MRRATRAWYGRRLMSFVRVIIPVALLSLGRAIGARPVPRAHPHRLRHPGLSHQGPPAHGELQHPLRPLVVDGGDRPRAGRAEPRRGGAAGSRRRRRRAPRRSIRRRCWRSASAPSASSPAPSSARAATTAWRSCRGCRSTRADRIELSARRAAFEPRVAIEAWRVRQRPRECEVVALHADVFPWSASANAKELAKRPDARGGQGQLLVAGDLNETPAGERGEDLHRPRARRRARPLHAVGPTFPGSNNAHRLHPRRRRRWRRTPSRPARWTSAVSDHLPVFAQFDLPQSLH